MVTTRAFALRDAGERHACRMPLDGERFRCRSPFLFSGKEILLLDEPFSAMNKELEYKVTERLLEMGRTIIMITHNSDEGYLKLFDNVVNIS